MISIPEKVLLVFSVFGVSQGILLALILYFHPKSDRSVNYLLSLYVFFISFPSIILVGQYYISWHVMIFVQPFLVLIGPLLYLYVRSFKEVITWKKAWPHFILFIIYLFIGYWFYEEVGRKYPAQQTVPPEVPTHPLYYVQMGIRSVQRIVYYFLSYKVLISYQRSIRHLFSDTTRINLHWVKWLINGYLTLVSVIIAFNLMSLWYPQYYGIWVLLIGLMVAIYIYVAAMKGIYQPTLWQVRPEWNKEEAEAAMEEAEKIDLEYAESERTKPRKTGLAENKVGEIATKAVSLLETEKLYKEPELTLQQLADRLQLPSYQLSQVINDGLRKNFYDLVNHYRVEEAKRLLLEPANKTYTILSIGFEAGFNSKTTFNTVFKKFTGQTPTEYRNTVG